METAAPKFPATNPLEDQSENARNRVDRNRVMMEGTFRAINMPVAIGIISSHGVMMELFVQAAATSAMCWVLLAS